MNGLRTIRFLVQRGTAARWKRLEILGLRQLATRVSNLAGRQGFHASSFHPFAGILALALLTLYAFYAAVIPDII